MSHLRVAEFYCGIGGLHFALRDALPEARVVAAFDVDRDGNQVYEDNTGLTPTKVDIQTLSVSFLETLNASMWLLSPPCQPFTRQGWQRDTEDPRTKSLLSLLHKMQNMSAEHTPDYVLLENVVGFEKSQTRKQMLHTFQSCQLFGILECVLSPNQLGIPYSRPRYFCLARKSSFSLSSTVIHHDPPLGIQEVMRVTLKEFLGRELQENESLEVPVKFLEQCADVLNVVSGDATLLNCFTKSYGGRYFKGTGSFLATRHPEWVPVVCHLQTACCKEPSIRNRDESLMAILHHPPSFWTPSDLDTLKQSMSSTAEEIRSVCLPLLCALLKQMKIRYFSPREIAALHSFPATFAFPNGMQRRRQYALLGNSLSVTVVSQLLQFLVLPDG